MIPLKDKRLFFVLLFAGSFQFFAVPASSAIYLDAILRIAQTRVATVTVDSKKVDERCLRELKETYLKEETLYENDSRDAGIKSYLSIKEGCEGDKKAIEECCANPNKCNGIGRDLMQHVLPLTPALYGAYKAFDLSTSGLNQEEAFQKMCDTNNKVAMGGYLSGLLAQLSTVAQTTCKDKILECEEQCENRISDFKEDFVGCFGPVTGKKSVGEIINVIEKYKEKENFGGIESMAQTDTATCSLNNTLIQEDGTHCCSTDNSNCANGRINSCCTSDKQAICIMDNNEPNCIETKTLAYMYLFQEAFKNSSALKGKNLRLSDSSSEKDIVNCSKLKNRMPSSSNQPGAPVPAPMIELCQRAVAEALDDKPPPNPRVSGIEPTNEPPPSVLLTGDDLNTGQYGIVPDPPPGETQPDPDDDDDFSLNNKPPLTKSIAGWQKNNSSGGSPGGGGPGASGAGSLAGDSDSSSKKKGGFGYNWPGGSSLGGGGFPSPSNGGYSRPGGSSEPPYPYRQAAADDSDANKNMEDLPPFDPSEDLDGQSIFQIASQRIQLFCSDHSCVE